MVERQIEMTPKITGIAAGYDGTLFAVDDEQHLWQYERSRRTWTMDPVARAKQIAVSSAFHLWAVNAAGEVWAKTVSGWSQPDKTIRALQVAVGVEGDVWAVKAGGEVWHLPPGETWRLEDTHAKAAQVELGKQDLVYYLNADGIIFRKVTPGWLVIRATFKARQIGVGSDGTLWAVTTDQHIQRLALKSSTDYVWQEPTPTARAVQITVGDADDVYCLNSAGSAFAYISGKWVELPPLQPTDEYFIYTVNPGDTLSGLATHFGTTVAKLMQVNHLVNPDRIDAGQQLRIPRVVPTGCTTYVIRYGDTMTGIARTFGITLTSLLDVNPQINNPDRIHEGDTVYIPAH
jgi:LysM repeat protein